MKRDDTPRSLTETDSPARILIVDDEDDICEIVAFHLERIGLRTTSASSAEEALRLMQAEDDPHYFSLIVLDVMMEGMSGFEMAEELRSEGIETPIIFLTAKSAEDDLLHGFTVGGDDYLTKPFSVKELVARVKSVLHRTTAAEREPVESDRIEVGPLVIDEIAMTVSDGSHLFDVTKTEYDLLRMLATAPGRTFTRQEILDRVWSRESLVLDRTVDVHIARLRKKLGKYGTMLYNRVGFGYGLRPMTLDEIDAEIDAETEDAGEDGEETEQRSKQ